jgi:hypothetical protein
MFFVSFSPNIVLREKSFSPNLVKYKQLALCVRACVQTCNRATARLHYRTAARACENPQFFIAWRKWTSLKSGIFFSGIFLKRKRTNERTNERTNKRTNNRTNKRKSNLTKKVDFWSKFFKCLRTNARTNAWTNKQTHARRNEQTKVRVNWKNF